MNGVPSMRIFLVWPLALVAAWLLALPRLHAADEATLRAALDRFAGEWTGEVQVKAMDGFVLKAVPAARRVAWEGDTLVVETTLSDGSSDYAVVARQAVRLGRLEASVSRPSQPVDRYLGEVVSGALVWTNAEGNRRDARDQVSERAGALVLETSSVEPIRALGLSGLVRVEGRYRRPAPEAASEAVPSRAPELEAEMRALRRALEQERVSVARLATRVDETERRAGAAASRVQTLEASLAESRAAEARLSADLENARTQAAGRESEGTAPGARLVTAEASSAGAASRADSGAAERKILAARVAALETELAGMRREREDLLARIAVLEPAAEQARRDNERLIAGHQQLEQERAALAARADELERRVATTPIPTASVDTPAAATASEPGATSSAATRDKLVAEVQQMERRVLELESERNAAREQVAQTQRQVEETRRLRDDTLMRFQAVVSELNIMREEKERLARANVSLQSEVRNAPQAARGAAPVVVAPDSPSAAPATTFDGKTADMVIAALQIIGVTRGDGEDKVILDGRLYRNGDLVEAQLGIVFVRVEDGALVFRDRRGREYRRRF